MSPVKYRSEFLRPSDNSRSMSSKSIDVAQLAILRRAKVLVTWSLASASMKMTSVCKRIQWRYGRQILAV